MTNPAALGPATSPVGHAAAPSSTVTVTATVTTTTGTPSVPAADPVLCNHCGRTASNGISCQGICVADSGY